jgi:hypothetical protein
MHPSPRTRNATFMPTKHATADRGKRAASHRAASGCASTIARAAILRSASVVAAGVAWLPAEMLTGATSLLRVVVAFSTIFVVHCRLLVSCFGQRQVYADLLCKLVGSAASDTTRARA